MQDFLRHLLVAALGGAVAYVDVRFLGTKEPNWNLLLVCMALIIVLPLARGFKEFSKGEAWNGHFLAFLSPALFGLLIGYMIVLRESSLGSWYVLVAVSGGYEAYLLSGPQSRDYVGNLASSYSSFPHDTRRVLGLLSMAGHQDHATDIIKALLLYNFPAVLTGWEKTENLVFTQATGTDHRTALTGLLERAKAEVADWPNQVGSPVDVISLPTAKSASLHMIKQPPS